MLHVSAARGDRPVQGCAGDPLRSRAPRVSRPETHATKTDGSVRETPGESRAAPNPDLRAGLSQSEIAAQAFARSARQPIRAGRAFALVYRPRAAPDSDARPTPGA